jgi:hypothetical protein
MLNLKTVGEVIATRELTLDQSRKITILIGKPQPTPEGIDWYCPFEKLGIGSGRIKHAMGVDAMQALVLVLQMVGTELYTSGEYKAGRLEWDCGVNGDLGFPVPDIIRDVLPGKENVPNTPY